jgi:hypothetical protein
MSPEGMKEWRESEAYKDYKKYHDSQEWADETVREISNRALRVIKGEATEKEEEKVKNYLSRASEQEAGDRIYGKGRAKISARTAALRNWGLDPTGKYS